MKNKKEENKISIRLNKEAMAIVNEAISNGCNKSSFINQCITSTVVCDKSIPRRISPHLCVLHNYVSHIESIELRENIEEELHEIWRALK